MDYNTIMMAVSVLTQSRNRAIVHDGLQYNQQYWNSFVQSNNTQDKSE